MLEEQTVDAIHQTVDLVLEHKDWPQYEENWGVRFLRENEWNWLEGTPPLEDC
jgi:hypothetical protein